MPETLVSFCAHPEDVATIALLAALCMLATAGLPAEAAGRADSAGRGAGLAATPANDAGNFKVIHAFRGEDGAVPDAGLIQASDGNFYGTTALGVRVGTVFRMTADGQVTVLHAFDGVDGRYPTAALVQGADGFLYGTTSRGGPWGWGTIFRISTSGDFTQLYAFTGYSDGAQPDAPLIQASDGNFYGTTVYGGIGTGNVFRMTPDGTVTDVHSFDRDAEHGFSGAYPEGGLLQASDGLLYGLVSGSGSAVDCKLRGGCGGIYRLALDGSSFAGISLAYWQGAGPWAS